MPSFISVQQWLGEQLVPLFFIGFAVLMGFALVYFSAQSRRASLARDRSRITPDSFAQTLAAYGFDPGIARMAYLYLQRKQRVAFPIDPRDDLDLDLGLDGEDVEQTVRDLLDQSGREYLPGLLESPLVTVVDLVRHIQSSPRREVAAAGRRIA